VSKRRTSARRALAVQKPYEYHSLIKSIQGPRTFAPTALYSAIRYTAIHRYTSCMQAYTFYNLYIVHAVLQHQRG
jgi:hypothetical protein